MIFDFDKIQKFYSNFRCKLDKVRSFINHPMTYSEKILYSHIFDLKELKYKKKNNDNFINYFIDRIAMQDATAQMSLLQFMQTKKNNSLVPTTIHCDHLIYAKDGYKIDLKNSIKENKEIYDFLKSASNKYGIGFWSPGSGIIHQIILENYAFPGGMMVGTDSHTPNAGGIGMLAIGVGGSEAAEIMSGYPFELKSQKIFGVCLKGKINGWTAPKDIILKLSGIIGVMGAKNSIIEYFGDGTKNISCTGKATICNMGAELGATSSIFPYDDQIKHYLYDNGRNKINNIIVSNNIKKLLQADNEIYQNPQNYYDNVIEIDLSTLEPYINGPFSPDKATPISNMKKKIIKNNWPKKIEVGLVGSCTNSSYEDLSKSISIIKQANKKNLEMNSKYIVTPGSKRISFLLNKMNFINCFKNVGATIFSNACGPCIGQWDRNIEKYKKNTIIHSFNRNFSSRNDGNPNTYAFIASPEIVTALSFSGDLSFDPRKDYLKNKLGKYVKFEEPTSSNFNKSKNFKCIGYIKPLGPSKNIKVKINKNSKRIQILEPFTSWDGENIYNVRLLIKTKGKCTTDHISMAGPWLKYRGHLEAISENLLIRAINFFNNKANKVKNIFKNEYVTVPEMAKFYKCKKIPTLIVGEENYGEGSSREHAAMEPRFLGVKVVLVKSFSRIHETNLKKQGILSLTFDNPEDYNKIQEKDLLNFYIKKFSTNKNIKVDIIHNNGKIERIITKHTYNYTQIKWFKFGSSLNFIRNK